MSRCVVRPSHRSVQHSLITNEEETKLIRFDYQLKFRFTHNGRKWTLGYDSSTTDASDSIWRCLSGSRPNLLRKMDGRIGLASKELHKLQPFQRVGPIRRHQECKCRQFEPYKRFRICGTLLPILQSHVCVRRHEGTSLRQLFHWPKHLWFPSASTSKRICRWHRSWWFSCRNKHNIHLLETKDVAADTHLSVVNGVNTGHIKPLK